MNQQLNPARLPEPPPAASFNHDLLDGERVVGWVGPSSIAFAGFANAEEAAYASWVAYRALARRVANREGHRPPPIDYEPLTLRPDGDHVRVSTARRDVARVWPPGTQSRVLPDAFAFELELPRPLDEITAGAKAYHLYRTLRRSGVRWSLWIPPRRPEVRARVEAPVAERAGVAGERRPMGSELGALALILIALVLGAVAPPAIAAVAVTVGLAALLVMRLTVLHAQWPRRAFIAPDRRPPHNYLNP